MEEKDVKEEVLNTFFPHPEYTPELREKISDAMTSLLIKTKRTGEDSAKTINDLRRTLNIQNETMNNLEEQNGECIELLQLYIKLIPKKDRNASVLAHRTLRIFKQKGI